MVEKEKHQVEREEQEKFDQLMHAWEEAHPEHDRGGQWWVYWDKIKQDHIDRLISLQKKIDDQYHKEMDQQILLAQHLSRISPLASFAYTPADLAGTGIQDRNRFMDLLPDYRNEITVFALERWILYDGGEVEGDYNIEGYPKFAYEESTLQDRIDSMFADTLVLGVWNILFFMGAYLSFLRYDMK